MGSARGMSSVRLREGCGHALPGVAVEGRQGSRASRLAPASRLRAAARGAAAGVGRVHQEGARAGWFSEVMPSWTVMGREVVDRGRTGAGAISAGGEGLAGRL